MPGAALLSDVAVLTFAGPDVTAFLQGYLTCDLNRLSDGGYHLAALTNLQGRVVASGWCVAPEPSRVEWIVHASVAERIVVFMAAYLAFSKTTLVRRSDDHLVVGLTGRHPPAPMIVDDVDVLQDLIATHEIVAERQWQLSCIEARVALVAAPVSERFLPQMLGLVEADAVDFDKGCYLGQEVVARAQHRGEVKRRLHRFRSEAPTPTTDAVLSAGDVLADENHRESGVVIAATGPRAEPVECLAVVREPPAQRYVAGGVTLVRVAD